MFKERLSNFTNYINYMIPNDTLLNKFWDYHQKRISEPFKLGILLGVSFAFWGFLLSAINFYTDDFISSLFINIGYIVISVIFIYLFIKFHLNGFLLIYEQNNELKKNNEKNSKRILMINKFIIYSVKWLIIFTVSLIIPGLIWYFIGLLIRFDFNNTSHYYNYFFIFYYILWFGSLIFLELIDFNSLYEKYFINS
ncbi:MAG: hypothetical protein WC907_02320 [Acholeplasmataceae bacterium]